MLHMIQENPLPVNASHGRRTLLAVAAGALAAGAGFAWWRFDVKGAKDASIDTLWSAEFDSVEGPPLRLADFKGGPLVVNFWATWCTPCVEEMPLLNAFYQQNKAKSWQVLGLAIDQPSAVKRFLAQYPVEYPLAMAGLNGTDLMTALGNQAGGLPFTLVIDAQSGLRFRKLGKLTQADINDWL